MPLSPSEIANEIRIIDELFLKNSLIDKYNSYSVKDHRENKTVNRTGFVGDFFI